MSLSKTTRFRILSRDGFTCRYCGRKAPDVVLEVDHIQPRALGGSDDASNLAAACWECNRGKRDKPLASPLTDAAAAGTVPHPDMCHMCVKLTGQHRSYAARAEAPAPPQGYVAYYICDRGHVWNSYWDSSLRWPADDIDAEISFTNDMFAKIDREWSA